MSQEREIIVETDGLTKIFRTVFGEVK